jgi:predicted CopG family antitoxin
MTYTTISIKKNTKSELKKLKQQFEAKSMDELVRKMIFYTKKKVIDDFSRDFKTRLKEKGLTLEDIHKSGENIRKEILKERGLL